MGNGRQGACPTIDAKKSEAPEAVFGHGVGDFFVDLVDLGQSIVVENEVGGGEGGFELLDGICADDGGGDEVILFAPGGGEGNDIDAEFGGDLLEAVRGFEGAIVDEAAGHAFLPFATVDEVVGETGASGSGAVIVFAREHPATQWGVGEEAHVFLTTHLSEFALTAAVDEGKIILHRVVSGEAVVFRLPETLHEAPRGFIAASDDADFACSDEFREGAERILVSHAVVRPVSLIEIDVIGLESFKAAFDRANDLMAVYCGKALAHRWGKPAVAGSCDLRGEDNGVAWFGFEPAADNFFGDTVFLGGWGDGVDFGDVEEVHAVMEGVVHDLVAGLFIGLFAEGHGAHADF